MSTSVFEGFPTFILIRILENVDWKERAIIMCSNKKFYEISKSDYFFMWCCQRLAVENGVYSNHSEILVDSWKRRFFDLFKLRRIWIASDGNDIVEIKAQSHSSPKIETITETKKFKINVFARFRPKIIKKFKTNTDANNNTVAEVGEENNNDDDETASISLPLHQRIALVKMSNKLTSTKAALKVLTEEGEWFDKKWKNSSNLNHHNLWDDFDENYDNNFTTFSSLTLNVATEQHDNDNNNSHSKSGNGNGMVASVQTIDPGTSRVIMLAPEVGLREFIFDGVFPQSTSQKHFYDTSIKKLVIDFINGFNTTAVVFGQTGSGKTYSMFGPDIATVDTSAASSDMIFHHDRHSDRGIIPRACVEVLTAVAERTIQNKITSMLSVSYVEVFGDQIFDLLRNGSPCGHSKVAAQRYVLSGAAERVVHSLADIEDVLQVGGAQKRFAATAMNDRSSRAHTVFILSLKQTKECQVVETTHNHYAVAAALKSKASKFIGAKTIHSKLNKSSPTNVTNVNSTTNVAVAATIKLLTKTSKFFFADLGGSEQVKKSLVDEQSGRVQAAGFEKADRMREAIYINLGLLALKKCVDAINNGVRYVPYQESKLTMLLSEGLGGNSKTSIVVCASMDNKHAVESLATLRFGEKCASVVTEARGSGHSGDSSMLESVLADLDKRIAECETEIRAKERWEVRQEIREDVLAENNTVESAQGRKEVKNVSVLVGAENERRLLVQLLSRKASLSSSSSSSLSSSTLNNSSKASFVATNNSDSSEHSISSYSSINDSGIDSSSLGIVNITDLSSSGGVVGFGKAYAGMYGLGSEYDPAIEGQQLNERFTDAVRESQVPERVKARGVAGWTAGEALAVDAAVLEQKAKTIKRNKLVYSGLS